MRISPSLLLPLLLAGSLLFAACDSSEPPPVSLGEFHVTVTFDDGEAFDLTGFASASTSRFAVLDSVYTVGDTLALPDTLRSSFTISLVEASPDGPPLPGQPTRLISFARMGGERPAPATYPLGGFDRDGFFGTFVAFDGTSLPSGGTVFASESGTLTIEISTDERIAGSFTFRAGSFGFEEGEVPSSATVTGTFDARFRDFGGMFPRGVPGL